MAAFDTPWVMSSSPGSTARDTDNGSVGLDDPNTPTTAAFSPVTLSNRYSSSKPRSVILVHQKTSLLLSTPPQITRVLAYSHYFLLPLNKLVGLLTWKSGDSWESFLLVVAFWVVILYGDILVRYAAIPTACIILSTCVYQRRFSINPLSSSTKGKSKSQLKNTDAKISEVKHQKTLDEIIETLRTFTYHCHILIDPFLDLIDVLESQNSKSSSLKQLIKTIFIRILIFSTIWIILSLEPINFITTKRTILCLGTLFLTWHSQPSRVARAILWRSSLIRGYFSYITGLQLETPDVPQGVAANLVPLSPCRDESSLSLVSTSSVYKSHTQNSPDSLGVKFTFILYENQRRWVGLGWTTNLFAYERAPWTDEHQNPMPSKDHFQLPNTENALTIWKWMDGSKWLVEGAEETDEGGNEASKSAEGGMGWIYYDNKWQKGRRGIDGWGCYTRRRKWYRDAEIVEASPENDAQ